MSPARVHTQASCKRQPPLQVCAGRNEIVGHSKFFGMLLQNLRLDCGGNPPGCGAAAARIEVSARGRFSVIGDSAISQLSCILILDQLIASPTLTLIKSFILYLNCTITLYRTVLISSSLIMLSPSNFCLTMPRLRDWLLLLWICQFDRIRLHLPLLRWPTQAYG